ncbi:hypothetical protein CASFOL_009825 [Castilleja foliolosa]|uniref:Uncharacterized protein n=1 Tax=Castilleja foliolosa TaxID=1961234 RepID=A0ABD3DQZ0_9LAMI
MLTMSVTVQPSIKGKLPCPFSIFSNKTFNSSVSVNPKALSLHHSLPRIRKNRKLPAAIATELAPSETSPEISEPEPAEEPQMCASRCENSGETKASVEVHMDGKEHWARAGSDNTGPRHGAAESLLLLAQERCMGGAKDNSREQALDITEENDHSS